MKSLFRRRAAALVAIVVCGAFALGLVVGLNWTGNAGDGKAGESFQPTAPAMDQGPVGIATHRKENTQSDTSDGSTLRESRLTEADSQSVSASSFGFRVFLPGTFVLDHGFLQSAGLPPGKVEAVNTIYGDSVEEVLQAEAKIAKITPAMNGKPPVLKIPSVQGSAREIVAKMEQELIAELGFVPGKLLSNSLSESSLFRSSLEAGEREIVIESLPKTTPEGEHLLERIWESYKNDAGTLFRSTMGIDYLEERYGDAGVRLIEMAGEE